MKRNPTTREAIDLARLATTTLERLATQHAEVVDTFALLIDAVDAERLSAANRDALPTVRQQLAGTRAALPGVRDAIGTFQLKIMTLEHRLARP